MKNWKIAYPPVSAQNLMLFVFILLISFATPSCKTKSGCPTKDYHAKVNSRGELTNKRGKTNLFSKSMRKKMKK